jgi:predicted ATP-grasp superfamily ATP-dependent carboligase
LIVAPSGRALAQAARAARYSPLVADFFDDLDTRDLAAANCLVQGDLACGFEEASLMRALMALSEGKAITGLVYGAGFEDRIELLQSLAERWPLLGNSAAVVAQVKNPKALAALCAQLRIDHPEVTFEAPASNSDEWLVKQAGGSGGIHVNAADRGSQALGVYYQRRVAGTPISSLVLADGTEASVLGFSEQWACPAPDQPWRYGGSARPASLDDVLTDKLTKASQDIAAATHLVGLNSVDFLIDGSDFHLIEINPRPGATLDIFHDHDGRLLRAHIEACQGHLPKEPLQFAAAEAAAFVYAPFAIDRMRAFDWPVWAADRQKPSSAVAKDDPLCTVTASGSDLAFVRHLLEERTAQILTIVSKTNIQREAVV